MKVELEIDFGPRRDVPPRAVLKYIRPFANRILVEEDTLLCHVELHVPVDRATVDAVVSGFYHRSSDVMDIRIALGRNNLNRLNIAVLRQTRIHRDVRPPIWPRGLHNQIFLNADDDIRLANLPCKRIGELARRWHVGGISLRSAGVGPLDERRDFLIGYGDVIIKLPDTHVLVDEPRRHLSGHDFRLDRLRPRPRLFISQQRHRRNRAFAVTGLAMLLEDRRDVLRECDLLLRHRRRKHDGYCDNGHQKRKGALHRHNLFLFCLLAYHLLPDSESDKQERRKHSPALRGGEYISAAPTATAGHNPEPSEAGLVWSLWALL